MTTGRVNVGGGGASLNIFTQLVEPQKKDGIWLQTSDKFRSIALDRNVYLSNSWVLNFIPDLPTPRAYHTTLLYKDFIYVFGGKPNSGSQSFNQDIYKYNLITGVWTLVGNIPWGTYNTGMVSWNYEIINNIVYFSGRIGTGTAQLKRYDLDAETWLTDEGYLPRSGGVHRIFKYGDDGLILAVPGDSNYVYQYAFSTKTWTQVSPSPYIARDLSSASIHLIDNVVYFAAGYYPSMKFDLITKTWSSIATSPLTTSGSPSLVFGNEIHIYGRGGYAGQEVIIYDTLTNTYSYGTPMLRRRYYTNAVFDPKGKVVYIVGGADTDSTGIYNPRTDAFTYYSKQYANDELVILVNKPYSIDPNQMAVKLFDTRIPIKNEKLVNYFLNAWIFNNSDLQEYPAYWGDGTKWTKFKN